MPKRKPRQITRPGLNEKIREVRLAAKMTQRELADAIGHSQAFIHQLESGDVRPNVHHLIAIAEATGHTFAIGADTVIFAE